MRSRIARWSAGLLVVAIVAGVLWVYSHPPLRSNGGSWSTGGYWDMDTIDIYNTGRWPLRLTGITVDGERAFPPFAIAVANFHSAEIASSAARHIGEPGYQLETGAVPGWRMEPEREIRHQAYGVRLLKKPGAPPARVVITYRYLGLPMKLVWEETR
ncbi:MAG TPA: hypothetical protein VNT75_06265 [Symbiobacteriaceae bacterium]|nr:hypothetical protein [Symbiobacteriaceae bacterium]